MLERGSASYIYLFNHYHRLNERRRDGDGDIPIETSVPYRRDWPFLGVHSVALVWSFFSRMGFFSFHALSYWEHDDEELYFMPVSR